MFHTLRKLVILAFCALVAGLGVFLYQKRALFDPLVDLIEVIQLPKTSRTAGQVTGKVVKVGEDYTFQVKEDQGVNYSLRLTGLAAPEIDEVSTNKLERLKDEVKESLTRMMLSNRVRVHLTVVTDQRSGLGIAYLGDTNVNAAIVEAGLARVKREYLKGLSWKDQYQLVRAESKAQAKKSGIWNRNSVAAALGNL